MPPPTVASAVEKIASAHIQQQLKTSGIAQVIVVLKRQAADSGAGTALIATPRVPHAVSAANLNSLRSCFTSSELSQDSALSRAAVTSLTRSRHTRVGVAAAAAAAAPAPAPRLFPNLGVMLGTVNESGLNALRTRDDVETITGTPQFSLIQPRRVSAARLSTVTTWGIAQLSISRLWREGLDGQGVRIAHLDTGVDGDHPVLRRALAAFAQFDDFGVQVAPTPAPFDSGEHGTHTAGTIAGRAYQGRHVGVAPKADLVSGMVIEGGNVVARVLAGIDWAIGQRIRVLSMSLGFRGYWEDFVPIVQILREQNILPVIAVGNEGPGTSRSPGNYDNVLSVGAADSSGQVAYFSSSQTFHRPQDPLVPDLIAPGVEVISARPGGGFQAMDGTSMATPHIAGLAALLFQADPRAAADAVEQAIFGSCTLSPGVPADRANRGLPDAIAALRALTGTDLSGNGSGPAIAKKKGKKGKKKR